MTGTAGWISVLAAVLLVGLGASKPAAALPISINYLDTAGEGFADPQLGAARRSAFEFAIDRWAETLAGDVPVVVSASVDPLGGSGISAVLAATSATTLHQNFPGAPRRDTFYAAALANQLAGRDLNGPELAEIVITFNGDVDGPVVLGSVGFWYGTDAQPGTEIDFVTIALHELGHGFHFFDTVNPADGSFIFFDRPGIYDHFLTRPGVGGFDDLLQAERLAASTSEDVVWSGAYATAFNGVAPRVYAPRAFQVGSSLSHWDVSFDPDELIEPFYSRAEHDLGALLPALADLGWTLAGASPTPRAPLATATPTPSPRSTRTATATGALPATRQLAYVSNFDAATVSVIDLAEQVVVDTLAVGDGPIGVAAGPDGRRVYVANFHSASLSVIDTQTGAVINEIPAGGSANGVALSDDGAVAYVTDTVRDTVSVIDLDAGEMIAAIPVGPQPAGIALDGDSRAFVTNFGSAALSVVDTRLNRNIGSLLVDDQPSGLLGIAIAPRARFGWVGSTRASILALLEFDTAALDFVAPLEFPASEALVFNAAETRAYATTHVAGSGAGRVLVIDIRNRAAVASIGVGSLPEALALSPDGARLCVANSGSDSVTVIDTASNRVAATVPVGAAPMGIAIANVPLPAPPTATATAALCAGDCDGNGQIGIEELIAGVAIALGRQAIETCAALDRDASGTVTVDELLRAVGLALSTCAPTAG